MIHDCEESTTIEQSSKIAFQWYIALSHLYRKPLRYSLFDVERTIMLLRQQFVKLQRFGDVPLSFYSVLLYIWTLQYSRTLQHFFPSPQLQQLELHPIQGWTCSFFFRFFWRLGERLYSSSVIAAFWAPSTIPGHNDSSSTALIVFQASKLVSVLINCSHCVPEHLCDSQVDLFPGLSPILTISTLSNTQFGFGYKMAKICE